MRLQWGCVAMVVARAACAQSAAEVTLTLAPKEGHAQFRLGEPIELTLQFRSTVPGKYAVWQRLPRRIARQAEYDRFTVAPTSGTVDPLSDSFSIFPVEVYVGPPLKPEPIDTGEVSVELFLNEWIAIRKPGHYKVVAQTTRLVKAADPNTGLPLTSKPLEIDVIPAAAEWTDVQLRSAVTVMEIPDPPPSQIGQREDIRQIQARDAKAEWAGRMLRFLETPEAARALVRYLGRGPMRAQPQLRAGIDATPHRDVVIAAVEEAVASPDIAISEDYYGVLLRFTEIARLGPMPAMTGTGGEAMRKWMHDSEMPYGERAKPIEAEVNAKMLGALEHKRGEALAVSLSTLSKRGWQMPSPALTKALLTNFELLPAEDQWQWLTSSWPRIAAPEATPLLTKLASGDTSLRDAALFRLVDLDPAAARPVALDRIRRGDVYRNAHHIDRALLALPDKVLPELDDALATNFERGLYHADLLLARYASPAVKDRVLKVLDRGTLCGITTLAYLFRVDPDSAAQISGSRRCSSDLPAEDLLMSPAMEQHLIKDSGSYVTVQALRNGGSSNAKAALFEMMNRSGVPPAPTDYMLADALLNAAGWVLTSQEIDRVEAGCKSDLCRQRIPSARALLQAAVPIRDGMPLTGEYASVGPFHLFSAAAVKLKIAQFPKGTTFTLGVGPAGTWYADRRTREFRQILQDAGMKVQ